MAGIAWRRGPSATTGLAHGAVAGILSGVALAALTVLGVVLVGQSPWTGVKLPAAPFFGLERVLSSGLDAGPVAIGILMHFAISACWGALFGAIVQGVSRQATVLLGAAWGILVWLLMHHMVLPLMGLEEIPRSTPVAVAIALHVAYGVVLGVVFLRHQPREPVRSAGRATA